MPIRYADEVTVNNMSPVDTTHRMFVATFQASAIGKAIVDLSGRCAAVNPSFAQMLGYTPAELVGVAFTDFTHPDDVEIDLALFEAILRGERDNYQLEKRYLRRDGEVVDVLLSTAAVCDDNGAPVQLIAEVVDITERKLVRAELEAANARLHDLAITDHLTRLRNRRGFEEALTKAMATGRFSVLLIDLDNFKHVNDRFGHEAGDAVLIEVGRRMAGELRDSDVLARLGGDEFAALLPGTAGCGAERVAANVVGVLAQPFIGGGAPAWVGASVGVASCDSPIADMKQLLARADRALYDAKRAGRGQWRAAA